MTNISSKTITPTSSDHASLREQTGRVLSEARELGSVAAAATSDQFDHAKEKGRELLSRTKDEGQRACDSVESYVREYPMRSLLCAVGVGAALMIILKR
jgi:ElaB/YqjD/DUF883 family membrane-anchored ribosome-binding protein